MKAASISEATIIEKKLHRDGSGLYERITGASFVHKLTQFPEAGDPDQPIVEAHVSKHIYERYNGYSSVWIHYLEADPYCFIIEGE